jgi:putative CocE/NonD family hydrolase
MRDGVRLCTNVFIPEGRGPFPAILVRTPYGKGSNAGSLASFVDAGYAVVVQDVRGRYHSDGKFKPVDQEGPDSDATLNWVGRQTWSDGGVGMIGGSYLGIVQWRAALTGNRHLKAIFPVVSGSDDYLDRFYSPGGAFKLGHRIQWIAENLRRPKHPEPDFQRLVLHLPLRTSDRIATGGDVDFYQEALDHPSYDRHWRSRSTRAQLSRIRIPVFSVGGWYDNFVQSDLETFALISGRRVPTRILIGPWPHNMSVKFEDVNYGPAAAVPVRRLQIQWFDRWLKKRVGVTPPPVRVFVMGANVWRDEYEWPLARTRYVPFYLGGSGANSLSGNGRLVRQPPRSDQFSRFRYDPRSPVPTLGGSVCCNHRVFPWGPMDQRPVEMRNDVLVYTSRPLRRDLEVTGPVKVVLYVATSAKDTDFTAKLVDVSPDGYARNLTDGILRLRYRNSLEKPEPVTPGTVYRIVIDAGLTSNVFKAGHSLRLEVSSSNFPRFDRNMNTGRSQANETQFEAAEQTVYGGKQAPSHVLLPVVPGSPR